MTQYRQAGVDYRASGVAYGAPMVMTPAGIAATATVPDEINLQYRESGLTYRNSYTYNEPQTGLATVIVSPNAVACTTSFSAIPSIPATVTPATVACPVVIVPQVTANVIVIHADIEVSGTIPSPTLLATATPADVAPQATLPAVTLFITVDATPSVVAAVATMPPETPSGNYTAVVDAIAGSTTVGAEQMYRLVEIPTENIVPSVGLPEDASPAGYALMRHFQPGPRGDNIFIVNGTTVQSYLPSDWGTVTRWIYGGHESPKDLTESEQTVLVAAGYSFRVGPE